MSPVSQAQAATFLLSKVIIFRVGKKREISFTCMGNLSGTLKAPVFPEPLDSSSAHAAGPCHFPMLLRCSPLSDFLLYLPKPKERKTV